MALLGHPLWRSVPKPLLATPDQHFALGYTRVIDAALPPQRNGNGVLFGIGRIAFVQVARLYNHRNSLAFGNVDDGQAVELIFRHHALTQLLRSKKNPARGREFQGGLEHLRQFRAPAGALVIPMVRLLYRNATVASAFVASNAQHFGLAD